VALSVAVGQLIKTLKDLLAAIEKPD